MRTRVTVCGITRAADAATAVELGADAIGLVFYPKSPRLVSLERAEAIARSVPPLVTVVGLFMDAPAGQVREVLDRVPLELLQFHGEESPEYCAGFGRRYMKALAMGSGVDPRTAMSAHGAASGFLLDAHRAGEPGGSGRAFDWADIPPELAASVVLAGGLRPDNVAGAVARVRPFGVDVASGVESAPGIKDPALMAEFIAEVNRANSI